MTAHDPIKAAAEELSGTQEVHKVLTVMIRDAERRAGEAEIQLNSLLKVRSLVGSLVDDQTTRLQVLRADAERQAQQGREDT